METRKPIKETNPTESRNKSYYRHTRSYNEKNITYSNKIINIFNPLSLIESYLIYGTAEHLQKYYRVSSLWSLGEREIGEEKYYGKNWEIKTNVQALKNYTYIPKAYPGQRLTIQLRPLPDILDRKACIIGWKREFINFVERYDIASDDVMPLLQKLIPKDLRSEVSLELSVEAALDKLVCLAYANEENYVEETKWLNVKQEDYILIKQYVAKINENLNIYMHLTKTSRKRQDKLRKTMFYSGLGECSNDYLRTVEEKTDMAKAIEVFELLEKNIIKKLENLSKMNLVSTFNNFCKSQKKQTITQKTKAVYDKYCRLHKTTTHSDAECFRQKAQREGVMGLYSRKPLLAKTNYNTEEKEYKETETTETTENSTKSIIPNGCFWSTYNTKKLYPKTIETELQIIKYLCKWKKTEEEGRTHSNGSTEELKLKETEKQDDNWEYRENDKRQLIVPSENGLTVVRAIYETTGHPGVRKLCNTVKRTFQVTDLCKIASKIVTECKKCQRYKKHNTLCPKNQSFGTLATTEKMKHISSNIIGPFQTSHFNTTGIYGEKFYIITITDRHTRWTELFTSYYITSKVIISVLSAWIKKHGKPDSILNDQRTQYTAQKTKDYLAEQGIKQIQTSAYNLTGNGISKRINQEINLILAHSKKKSILQAISIAYNRLNLAYNSAIKTSPYEKLYGIVPFDPRKKEDQNSLPIQNSNQETSKIENETKDKRPEFNINDLVYVESHKPGKLAIKWEGPYKVIGMNEEKTVITIKKKNGKVLQRNLKQIRLCPTP